MSRPPSTAPSSSVPHPSTPGETPATSAHSGPLSAHPAGSDEQSEAGGKSHDDSATSSSRSAHALGLADYLFNTGFIGQSWADVELHFFGTQIRLHRIILARSPYLHNAFFHCHPMSSVVLRFEDESITRDSVHIALRHLYTPSQPLVNPSNARSVFATAYILGGMDDLLEHAYTLVRQSISEETVLEYVQWLDQPTTQRPQAYQGVNGVNGHEYPSQHGAGPSTMYGSVLLNGQTGGANGAIPEVLEGGDWLDSSKPGRYGDYSNRLQQDVLDFLTTGLPHSLVSSSSSLSASPQLLHTYAPLPYLLFKYCLESPALSTDFGSIQDQFGFAKKAVAQRKKIGSSPRDMDEAVVLAMGDGSGMRVHVTRKPKKGRALWKVEG